MARLRCQAKFVIYYANLGALPMPPAKPLTGKRYPLNMRTTRELREQVERAARASGRSLVQEVEYRLEQSFAGDPLVKALTGGGDTALRLIALAMQFETAA